MTIELALLGFLDEGPRHGYEIYQRLSDARGLWQVWRLKQSRLYALLGKLEDARYLAATLQPQAARPPRKVYTLTEAGQGAYELWLAAPVARGRQMRIEFLIKLYFAARRGAAATVQLLDRQLAVCEVWLEETLVTTGGAMRLTTEEPAFAYVVAQYRRRQVEAFLAFLADCRLAYEGANMPDTGLRAQDGQE